MEASTTTTMDKDDEEMKQPDDTRTLVTALTRQLNLDTRRSPDLTDTSTGLSHATSDDTVPPEQLHANTRTRAPNFSHTNDTFIYHDDGGDATCT
jgi:hypothetical protein